MTSAVIIHQHTNNYGDDAAGAALATQLVETLGADHVDLFYIWQKDGAGIPLGPSSRYTNHLIPQLSGSNDVRASLAVALAANVLLGRPLPAWLRSMIATAKRADHVFVSPAGANVGIYKDWTYLLVLLAMVRSGVRPIFHLNTIGQSNSRIFDFVARIVLRNSELNVRESASAEWLASKRLSAYLGMDTAILLPDPPEAPSSPATADQYIAVVPTRLANWHRDFKHTDDGLIHGAIVRAVAEAAITRDLSVVLVPHLYGPEDESALLDGLRDALIEAGCRARVLPVSGHLEYLGALRGATAVLSMRYHGLVLAAISGVPCVAIAYENKMIEAAAYLGVADLCRDSSIEATEMSSLLVSAIDSSAEYAASMQDRISTLKSIALGPIRAAQARDFRRASATRG